MSNVLVVGGGFAGVWCAAGVMRTCRDAGVPDRIRVTLVDSGDDMVIRPRLYESDPQRMRVPLDRVLGPIGVRRVAATVTRIDTAGRWVTAVGRDGRGLDLPYDRLVLAAGSRAVRPGIEGAEHLFDVDSMPGAAALHAHLHRLGGHVDDSAQGRFTAVVIGAGFTGLEVATELVDRLHAVAGDRPSRVVLVERAAVVGPELGAGPRPQILDALAETGVEVRLGTQVARLDPAGVTFADGTTIAARTVVWTAGMRASALTEQVPGERDPLGRLRVDEFLRVVGVPGVYAAGDTAVAEPGHVVMQSCQHAVPQGKFVGVNVASDLLGRRQVPFAPDPYVTCLDLGSYGAVLTTGWDRVVAETREEAKSLKRSINGEWIYPPLDDAETILDHADHRTTWPTATVGQSS
jgi:NADH:ubiquinone reductase (H+-translocating)